MLSLIRGWEVDPETIMRSGFSDDLVTMRWWRDADNWWLFGDNLVIIGDDLVMIWWWWGYWRWWRLVLETQGLPLSWESALSEPTPGNMKKANSNMTINLKLLSRAPYFYWLWEWSHCRSGCPTFLYWWLLLGGLSWHNLTERGSICHSCHC